MLMDHRCLIWLNPASRLVSSVEQEEGYDGTNRSVYRTAVGCRVRSGRWQVLTPAALGLQLLSKRTQTQRRGTRSYNPLLRYGKRNCMSATQPAGSLGTWRVWHIAPRKWSVPAYRMIHPDAHTGIPIPARGHDRFDSACPESPANYAVTIPDMGECACRGSVGCMAGMSPVRQARHGESLTLTAQPDGDRIRDTSYLVTGRALLFGSAPSATIAASDATGHRLGDCGCHHARSRHRRALRGQSVIGVTFGNMICRPLKAPRFCRRGLPAMVQPSRRYGETPDTSNDNLGMGG